MSYDAAGNLTNDGYLSYAYDATGQQTSAGTMIQSYDGDRLRVKKVENGATTYYLRSSVLGGQVISELNASGVLQRGYVYLGSELLALQQSNQVSWVHQDPVTKSQRITNGSGIVTSTIDLDPWGGETSRSSNQAFQPHRYTTYERDGNGGDEAMMRRYAGKWHRFVQPDPSDGSYDFTNPQSLNRYAYVQSDPVNLVDPLGLDPDGEGGLGGQLALATMGPGRSIVDISIGGAGYGGFMGGGGEVGMVIEPVGRTSDVQIPVPLPSDLKDRVDKKINNPATDCGEFITKVIKEAARLRGKAYSTNPLSIFNRIQGEGGFHLKILKNSGEANFTSDGKRLVYINEVSETGVPRKVNHVQNAYANVALNEGMHHAAAGGVYGDRTLARALFNSLTTAEQLANPLPKTNDYEVNGRYFHSLLTGRCPSP
jgi:RHS repeat-associated protein